MREVHRRRLHVAALRRIEDAMTKVMDLTEAAGWVQDGATIAFGGSSHPLWRRPMSFVRELVRQGRRELGLFQMLGGLETDLLLGARCVGATDMSYAGLGEFGPSHHFQHVARSGEVEIREYSELLLAARLRAAEMGLPYLPWKTAIGTDVVARLGWSNLECPYTGQSLLAVPAAEIDVAVIHVRRCDPEGNVDGDRPRQPIDDYDHLLCRVADLAIVCAEQIAPLERPAEAPLLAREVDAVVDCPHGAWPGGFAPLYDVDHEHLVQDYLPASGDVDGFGGYLDEFVLAGDHHD